MPKKIITSDHAPKPVGPYSQAVESGGFLFCSGQISIDPKTNEVHTSSIQAETEQIMKNIEAVLNAAQLKFDDVVKTTIFLTSMSDFATVNEIYARHFSKAPPARSCVAVSALPKGVHVEIEVLAKCP